MKRLTTEQFINKALAIHGDRYDYSLANYVNAKTPVDIICKEHGLFSQTPSNHLDGRDCIKCSYKIRLDNYSKGILDKKFIGLVQPEEYKLIPLGNNKYVKVDNEDFDKVKDINWRLIAGKYAGNDTVGNMHRYIMDCPNGLVVDHKNHDTLDNRRENLRVATYAQNIMNTHSSKGSSSEYKGVCWDKSKGKWAVHIGFNYKKIFIGYFDEEKEAALAYNKRAQELFGEFAKLNIIK